MYNIIVPQNYRGDSWVAQYNKDLLTSLFCDYDGVFEL